MRNYGCGAVLWFNSFLPTTGKAKTGATSKTPAYRARFCRFSACSTSGSGGRCGGPSPVASRRMRDRCCSSDRLCPAVWMPGHIAQKERETAEPKAQQGVLVAYLMQWGLIRKQPTNPIGDCNQVSRNDDSLDTSRVQVLLTRCLVGIG